MSQSSCLTPVAITRYFRILPDPRRAGKVQHPLINLIVMAVCAVIAGADDFSEIAAFAKERRDWFAKFLDLSSGVPSHDTFSRVFRVLDPLKFQTCLVKWVTALHELTQGQIIAIDGKVVREAFARSTDQGPLTLVSAWATANQICLGQVAGPAGSNELGALPTLLELLELKGAIVTLDALGCQKNIVKQIVEKGGDYVISVKDNQAKLASVVEETIGKALEAASEETISKRVETDVAVKGYQSKDNDHGRAERRVCTVVSAPEFADKKDWAGIKTFAMVAREYVDLDGKCHSGVRYFVSSLPLHRARTLFKAVRAHWTVENQLHWRMDVIFNEDASRSRLENAQANLGMVRRTALSMVKNDETQKGSIKCKRKSAGWNEKKLEGVIFGRELGKN
jgi:predicted transposase YbfD/YdcC